jgi:hypothetical protein
MNELLKTKTELPCPGGGSSIKTTYGDVMKKSKLSSSKGEFRFKSQYQYKMKSTVNKMESLQKKFEKEMGKAQEDFSEAFQNVISNADVVIKR